MVFKNKKNTRFINTIVLILIIKKLLIVIISKEIKALYLS